jgi:two-component system sensor histidine kinase CpxA
VRSLLARIFASFWVAMVLIVAGAIGVTLYVLAERTDGPRRDPAALAEQATAALQSGGETGLKRWLSGLERRDLDTRLLVVGPKGEDLLGRPVPRFLARRIASDMSEPGHERPPPPLPERAAHYRPAQPLPLIIAGDGTVYRLALMPRRPGFFGTLEVPQARGAILLLAIVVTALISWWLARSVTRPVRALTAAARALAGGDLDIHLPAQISGRRDELGVLARDFEDMARRLRELLRGRERLLRDVSHELRSPLARMQVAVALGRQPGGDVGQSLQRIESEAGRLDALIDQVLRLSRLDAGASALKLESVDLVGIVDQVARDASFEGQGCGVRVQWEPPDGTVIALVDAELLASAIENIVRNALRYSPPGGAVEIALEPGASEALLRVRDHGPGVPEAELQRIFEPFFRVAESRSRESGGDGIGLAITARVVAAHGGTTRAQNAAGGGLQIELRLPLQPGVPRDPPAPARRTA